MIFVDIARVFTAASIAMNSYREWRPLLQHPDLDPRQQAASLCIELNPPTIGPTMAAPTCEMRDDGVLYLDYRPLTNKDGIPQPDQPLQLTHIIDTTTETGQGHYPYVVLTGGDILDRLFSLATDPTVPDPEKHVATELLMEHTAAPLSQGVHISVDGHTSILNIGPGIGLPLDIPPDVAHTAQGILAHADQVHVRHTQTGEHLTSLADLLRILGADSSAITPFTLELTGAALAAMEPADEVVTVSPYLGAPTPTEAPPPPPNQIPTQQEILVPVGVSRDGTTYTIPLAHGDDKTLAITTAQFTQKELQALMSGDPQQVLQAIEQMRKLNRPSLVARFMHWLFNEPYPPNNVEIVGGGADATDPSQSIVITDATVFACDKGMCLIGTSPSGQPSVAYIARETLKYAQTTAIVTDSITREPQDSAAVEAFLHTVQKNLAKGQGTTVYLVRPDDRPNTDDSVELDQFFAKQKTVAVGQAVPVKINYTVGGAKKEGVIPLPVGTPMKLIACHGTVCVFDVSTLDVDPAFWQSHPGSTPGVANITVTIDMYHVVAEKEPAPWWQPLWGSSALPFPGQVLATQYSPATIHPPGHPHEFIMRSRPAGHHQPLAINRFHRAQLARQKQLASA